MPRAKRKPPPKRPKPDHAPMTGERLRAELLAALRDDDPQHVREWVLGMVHEGEWADGADCQPRPGPRAT